MPASAPRMSTCSSPFSWTGLTSSTSVRMAEKASSLVAGSARPRVRHHLLFIDMSYSAGSAAGRLVSRPVNSSARASSAIILSYTVLAACGFFGDLAEQGGFAGFVPAGGEDGFLFASKIDTDIYVGLRFDLGGEVRWAADGPPKQTSISSSKNANGGSTTG
jgi:hypothetical protein